MFGNLGKKIFGSSNERELNKLRPIIQKVNDLENEMSSLNQDQLINKTSEFKERIGNGENLESILPEAFSIVREAAKRTLNQRHFDVFLCQ